jgi:hypothetical protein
MSKIIFPSFLAFLVLASLPISSASIDVIVDEPVKSGYLDETTQFNLTISNSGFSPEDVAVSVTGPHLEWYQGVYSVVTVHPNRNATKNLDFFPTGFYGGEFVYTISSSLLTQKETQTHMVKLVVLRPIDIESVAGHYQGKRLTVKTVFSSIREDELGIEYEVRDLEGNSITKTSETSQVLSGETEVSKSINLPENILAGEYQVLVSVESLRLESGSGFTIEPVQDLITITTKESTALYEDVLVSIQNNGNIIEKGIVNKQTVPNNDWISGLITAPDECTPQLDKKECRYVINSLMPGETAFITYRLEFWPIYAQYALVIIIIISVIAFSFMRAASPKIVKRYVGKGTGKHAVVIEIKNPFFRNMKNVIVRDWISPLAHVLQEEIDSTRPALRRRSDAGTELIWKLGDIKPNETRILTYKIKTLVQGSLKMPRAYMRYHNEKGKRFRALSKAMTVE